MVINMYISDDLLFLILFLFRSLCSYFLPHVMVREVPLIFIKSHQKTLNERALCELNKIKLNHILQTHM